MNIQIATTADIEALNNLLNTAYRGEDSKKGWTSEADLISGTVRTNQQEIHDLITQQNTVFLKYVDVNNVVCGCVNLQINKTSLYLGMLSVVPTMQAHGIGKKLLLAAEDYAKQNKCNRIYMTVISVRSELIDWYKRNGYDLTGETKPFPTDHASGIPNQKLEFVVLEKYIN